MMAEGIVDQAKEAAPIRRDEQGNLVGDIGKTGNYILDNPVDTALAVAPFVPKGVGKIPKPKVGLPKVSKAVA